MAEGKILPPLDDGREIAGDVLGTHEAVTRLLGTVQEPDLRVRIVRGRPVVQVHDFGGVPPRLFVDLARVHFELGIGAAQMVPDQLPHPVALRLIPARATTLARNSASVGSPGSRASITMPITGPSTTTFTVRDARAAPTLTVAIRTRRGLDRFLALGATPPFPTTLAA
jgi:hypothetical protein